MACELVASAEQPAEVPGSLFISRDDLIADAIKLIANGPGGHGIDVAVRLSIDNVVGHF